MQLRPEMRAAVLVAAAVIVQAQKTTGNAIFLNTCNASAPLQKWTNTPNGTKLYSVDAGQQRAFCG